MHLKIIQPPVEISLADYVLKGSSIVTKHRRITDMEGVFQDQKTYEKMDPEQIVYTVQAWLPVPEGTPGGLFFGTTKLMPGKVGNEYFMTKGHFHTLSDRAEFYWGVQGKGMLILMDGERNTWAEEMCPGSLHYIPAHVAHRVANVGDSTLIFGACWPSDAGHDYTKIADYGFSARILEIDGKSVLIEE